MSTGLLVLRLLVGLLLAGSGAQKLLGWFGGEGLTATSAQFAAAGFRGGRLTAALGAVSEIAGGLALAAGLLTPLASAALVGVLTVAVGLLAPNGLWNQNGGFEYPLVLACFAAVTAWAGPGEWALDHAIGWSLHGPGWGAASTALGLAGAAAVLGTRRRGGSPSSLRPT